MKLETWLRLTGLKYEIPPLDLRLAPKGKVPEQERAVSGFRDYMRTQFVGHGMGRHTPSEIYQLGIADLGAIADLLGDKPFMMGEFPTTVDATIDAYVAKILFVPIESPLKEFGLRQENLVAYCQRIRSRFYPEMNPFT